MHLTITSSVLSDTSKVFSVQLDHEGQRVELECVSERHAHQLLADLKQAVEQHTNLAVDVN